ncbi:MAG: GumC family protein [Bacteroidales bacterium]
MNIIDILRLLKKHLVLLLVTPALMALLVTYFTRKPHYTFSSETILYTGIASGSSVEMDKSFSFFANNTAFDNLINVIKSRETQQEVAIRLLAQHLMLPSPDPKYISHQSFVSLRNITPAHIYKFIAKSDHLSQAKGETKSRHKKNTAISDTTSDTLAIKETFSFSSLDTSNTIALQPPSIDPVAYEQTVKNLKDYMAKSDTNFVYKLLNFTHPHYSLNAIANVTVQRIGSSDLVKLKYESDDPGICRQTLVLFTDVCIQNYKNIKENRSDAVVKYFEFQVKQAAARLKVGEDKLLKFNEDHNIINYYEQSKAVAIVKEDLDVSYHNKRIELAGAKAAIKRIEEKLGNQQQIQLSSASIIEKRNQLGDINSKIAMAETIGFGDSIDDKSLVQLKIRADKLKEEMRNSVSNLYSYGNTTEGLPIATLLNDWLTNVIQYEETKAGLDVLGDRIVEFQKQYAIYAPAGANIKRIEREINVAEQEFLELLHGLNMAKLKMQDAELSSSIKTVDPPFFPLSPNPTKRKLLVIVAALIGFILVLATILAMEYFDETLRNPKKAAKILNLDPVGVFPKIYLKTGSLNFLYIANRLLEMIIQHIGLYPKDKPAQNETRTLLFFSTLDNEGKTVMARNIAVKLKMQGKKVLVLNYARESLHKTEVSQIGYAESQPPASVKEHNNKRSKISYLSQLIGYGDTRVDYNSPFLDVTESNFAPGEFFYYKVDADFFSVSSYSDILAKNNLAISHVPDFVLIELPPILYYPYPPDIVPSADISLLICRANHVWSQADQNTLDSFMKLTANAPMFLLNGVEMQVIESVLGDLPKKRSRFRRILKKLIRFQVFTRYNP